MSTCKDCIHNNICKHYVKSLVNSKNINFENSIEKFCEIAECDHCEDFQDRSKFIELPCKVGQMVYRICPVPKGKGCRSCSWEYCDCHDIGYQKDRHNSVREGEARDFEWIIKRMPYFGRIYFSTREEAEQALKEQSDD